VPYRSASTVVIHYEEALYQVYGPLPFYRFALELANDVVNAKFMAKEKWFCFTNNNATIYTFE